MFPQEGLLTTKLYPYLRELLSAPWRPSPSLKSVSSAFKNCLLTWKGWWLWVSMGRVRG